MLNLYLQYWNIEILPNLTVITLVLNQKIWRKFISHLQSQSSVERHKPLTKYNADAMLPLYRRGVCYNLHVHAQLLCYIRKNALTKKAPRKMPCIKQQQLKTLQGVEALTASVGAGSVFPRAPHFTQPVWWMEKWRFTYLTLSEQTVMLWRENAKSNETTPPWTHHISSFCFWDLKKLLFFLATERLQPSSPFNPFHVESADLDKLLFPCSSSKAVILPGFRVKPTSFHGSFPTLMCPCATARVQCYDGTRQHQRLRKSSTSVWSVGLTLASLPREDCLIYKL